MIRVLMSLVFVVTFCLPLRAAQELNIAVLDFELTGVSKVEGNISVITSYYE